MIGISPIAKKYSDLFSTPMGQEVLSDLLDVSNFRGPSHTAGDPYRTAYNDGVKHLVWHILSQFQQSNGAYISALSSLSLTSISNQQEEMNVGTDAEY